jgi:hypothetical protein
MSMSISLRGRTQGTSEASNAGSTQQAQGAAQAQGARAQQATRGPDVIVGQAPSEQARRLEQASGRRTQTTCTTRPTDSQLAEQYRTMLGAGITPRIPAAPPLPRGDGASLMRELRIPAPRLPALYQAGLDHHGDTHSFIMGALVNGIAGGHASDQAHAITDILAHAAVECSSHHFGHGRGLVPTITNGAATMTRASQRRSRNGGRRRWRRRGHRSGPCPHAQGIRVLNQVTGGAERDASQGMRMLSASPERVGAQINLDE